MEHPRSPEYGEVMLVLAGGLTEHARSRVYTAYFRRRIALSGAERNAQSKQEVEFGLIVSGVLRKGLDQLQPSRQIGDHLDVGVSHLADFRRLVIERYGQHRQRGLFIMTGKF